MNSHCCVCNESACGEHSVGSLTWCDKHKQGRIVLGMDKTVKAVIPAPAMSVAQAMSLPIPKAGFTTTPNDALAVLQQQQKVQAAQSVAEAQQQQALLQWRMQQQAMVTATNYYGPTYSATGHCWGNSAPMSYALGAWAGSAMNRHR